MNEAAPNVSDAELHAFVDAQLDPERLPAVLAWLKDQPADTSRVLHWQAQRVQLRGLAAAMDPGPTPPALTGIVMNAARRANRRPPWLQAAAVLLLVSAGIAGGRYWSQFDGVLGPGAMASSPHFVREAAVAHAVFVPEMRHPVEVTATDEAHLVQWLSRRLGAPLKAPTLAKFGYHLLGGRLLPGEGTPRAQFMFEDAQGRRVTLYVAVFAPGQAPDATSFRSVRIDDEESFYWIEDRFGYALNAKASGFDMQALAREVYTQLQR